MGRSFNQFVTLIRNNITDALLRQNTAKRVRTVLEAFAADYFNKESDSLEINQVNGLVDALAKLKGRQPAVTFTNKTVVLIDFDGPSPPLTQVFNTDGYLIGCDVRYIVADKKIEFTFSEPQSGTVVF